MVEPVTISFTSPQEYCDEINGWLQTYDGDNMTETGAKTIVRGVQTQERGGLLLELDSKASATRFCKYSEETDLLSRFGIETNITAKLVQVVFRFVPCNGDFKPENREHLNAIEDDLGLPNRSIMAAKWIKKPERRTTNQKVANVKFLCATPQTGNKLLTEPIYIAGNRISARKDLKEPPLQ